MWLWIVSPLACRPLGDDEVRTAWLVDTLVAENRVWASRDPTLLATKYSRMALDPYDFLRGTAGLYQADLARPTADRVGIPFAWTPPLTQVLVAGDPHPENFGTFLATDPPAAAGLDDPLTLEIADLDGAGFGPYTLDVRRVAIGVALILDSGGCDPTCRRPALEALAQAYADVATGRYVPDASAHGAIVEDLFDKARAEGLLRETLLEVTEQPGDGPASLVRDAALDPDGRGVLDLTVDEAAQAQRLLDDWPAPEGARVLDVARAFGVGVSSLPAVRLQVLWDRGEDGPDDDDLMELREIVDPPAMAGLGAPNVGVFASNADRLATASTRTWSSPRADPRAAWFEDGPIGFKASTATDWFTGFDHQDIAEGLADQDYDADDVAGWVTLLGTTLAAGHLRAGLQDGSPAPLAADLAGREDTWRVTIADVAELDLGRLRSDHALFLEALDRWGPLLGADTLATDPVPW